MPAKVRYDENHAKNHVIIKGKPCRCPYEIYMKKNDFLRAYMTGT